MTNARRRRDSNATTPSDWLLLIYVLMLLLMLAGCATPGGAIATVPTALVLEPPAGGFQENLMRFSSEKPEELMNYTNTR